MEWKFDAITPQTTKVDPKHIEFFQSEALDDVTAALIREDIQNRLDARAKNAKGPVLVRYFLSGEEGALNADKARAWFEGLDPHLNSKKSLEELKSKPICLERPMPFLTIEDFNTTGLKGDPLATKDPEDIKERNDFYWFIRNVGRTQKKAGDRGRWGLGKIVYPAASAIRSFFCYSVREDDCKEALIGRSVLQIHSIEGEEYQSEGYYGEFPDSQYPYFAAPSEDKKLIREFVECFNITRTSDQPGLSLVIPFPDSTIEIKRLIVDIIKHYFWEIQKGTIEIEVSNNKGEKTRIAKDTIHDIASSWPGLDEDEKVIIQRRIEFCRKVDRQDLRESDIYFELKKPSAYTNPSMVDLFESEDAFGRASQLFQNGDIVALELPVVVEKISDGKSQTASFWVYLQRDDEIDKPDESVIRDGLTIIGEKSIQLPSIRAFVLAEDFVLTEFLGDAENPAHTRWLPSTNHFKGKYAKGPALLDYVKKSANRLANCLARIENQRLPHLLDHIFGIVNEDGRAEEKKPKGKGKKTPQPIKPPKHKRQFAIEQLEQKRGFKVMPTSEADKTPASLRIRMAYEVMQGNAFSYYHPSDFDLSNQAAGMRIAYKHCHPVSCRNNEIEVVIENPEFAVEVTGFDANRDLRVDVKPDYQNNSAGGAE